MTCSLCHRPPDLFATGCPRCDLAVLARGLGPWRRPEPAPDERPAPPVGRPFRLALVACGQRKAAEPRPAGELYTGSLTRAALRAARAWKPDALVILSARHGAVPADRVLAPYDQRLPGPALERHLWAQSAANQLSLLVPAAGPVEVLALAGAAYLEPLLPLLPARLAVQAPLAGLTLGQRLRWLSHAAPTGGHHAST